MMHGTYSVKLKTKTEVPCFDFFGQFLLSHIALLNLFNSIFIQEQLPLTPVLATNLRSRYSCLLHFFLSYSKIKITSYLLSYFSSLPSGCWMISGSNTSFKTLLSWLVFYSDAQSFSIYAGWHTKCHTFYHPIKIVTSQYRYWKRASECCSLWKMR